MLETREGFEATTTQCADWLRTTGFVDVTTRHLLGPTSMVFGYKPGRLPEEPETVSSIKVSTGDQR
jgi:hypothetical protein